MLKISVVTPSYNQARYLEECLLSVKEQNYPNVEHIVVDDGSTDNSREILKRRASTPGWEHLRQLSYHRVLYVPTNAAFFRRRVSDEGNYIDVQFDYAMDYEFFMRLARRGHRFKHVSYLLADYRWHPGSKTVSQAAKQLGEHDRIAQSYSPVLQKLPSSLANKLALRALRLMAAGRRYAEKFVWGYYFEQFRPPATLVERSR